MAIQRGIIPLTGKAGTLVGYRLNGKNIVRSLPQPYELTANTWKAASDFGKASAAASLVNRGLSVISKEVADNQLYHRLSSVLIKVIGSASHLPQGKREAAAGNLALFKGLQLNRFRSVQKVFPAELIARVNPGQDISISWSGLGRRDKDWFPPKAASLVIKVCCCACDFPGKQYTVTPFEQVISLKEVFSLPAPLHFFAEDINNRVAIIAAGFHYLDEYDRPIGDRKWRAGSILEAVLVRGGEVVTFP
jgi:hypothetical protein